MIFLKIKPRPKPEGKRKKRKWKHTGEKKCKYLYECIDGNMTYYPVAYCQYHDGVLTKGLMHTHRCHERHCKRLQEGDDYE
jgi:hypothetical protein